MNLAGITASKPNRELFFYFRYLHTYFSDYYTSNKGRLNTSKILVYYMKSITRASTRIMEKVCEGLENLGDHKKIQNSTAFMPLDVEVVGSVKAGMDGKGVLISLTHFKEESGDLLHDPDMMFIKATMPNLRTGKPQVEYYPITFQNDCVGTFSQGCLIENQEIHQIFITAQKSMTEFANIWLHNIKEQQFPGEELA
jgi:hypothetical protein